MRKLLFGLCWGLALHAGAVDISGAGSSAAHPLYERMAEAYAKVSRTHLAYQPVGSSAGIKQIKGRSVDFGASDVALDAKQSSQDKLLCFPSAISGVVPVLNLPGIRTGELQLTGEVLADIFAGRVRKWNDPRIASLNPHLALPAKPIIIIVRSDGSGTTYNFTDYLARVSLTWQHEFGRNFTIRWPDESQAYKGSGGVVAALQKTSGAIAYVDYNYVLQDHLNYARLRNADGKFVAPSPEGFAAALNNSAWQTDGGFEEMLTNKTGADSWPITMGTFVIVPRVTSNPAATTAALKFFTWSFIYGDAIVGSARFVHLPERVQARVFGEFTRVTDAAGNPLPWSLADILAMRP